MAALYSIAFIHFYKETIPKSKNYAEIIMLRRPVYIAPYYCSFYVILQINQNDECNIFLFEKFARFPSYNFPSETVLSLRSKERKRNYRVTDVNNSNNDNVTAYNYIIITSRLLLSQKFPRWPFHSIHVRATHDAESNVASQINNTLADTDNIEINEVDASLFVRCNRPIRSFARVSNGYFA